MAVVLEAHDVVIRVDAVEADYPGGMPAFRKAVPNTTFCSDGRIGRVSFMVDGDRAMFLHTLAQTGLRMHIDFEAVGPDTVLQSERFTSGRYGGVPAAWLTDEDPEPLVAPLQYRPHSVTHFSADEIEQHLEYVETRGAVEVYRDRRTGQHHYVARTQRQDLSPEDAERLERLRMDGVKLLQPFLPLDGPRARLGFFERRKLEKGLKKLHEVLEAVPDHGPSLWFVGMVQRGLGEHDVALDFLARAHAAEPGQKDFGREYAAQLMIVGDGTAAVEVSRRLCDRFPDDAGLRSNLGLALIIAQQPEAAAAEVQGALQLEPNDPVTRALERMITEVLAGRRAAPHRMPGWS